MKLSRFSKQIIAVVCSIAMVVAGLVFVPGIDAEAAPDYSGLTYAALGNNQNSEFNQKLYDSEIAVADGTVNFNVKQYQNAGFNQLYLALGGKSASSATLNGDANAIRPSGDQLFVDDAGASLTTYEYNVIDVVFSDSTTAKIIIHLPNNPGGGTYDPAETTTPDPSAPTTTVDPWKVVEGNPANQYYYNNTTKQNINYVGTIQQPGWSEEVGIYVSVPAGISTIDVNGSTSGVGHIDGAGAIVFLSALSKKINEVTITYGGGTSYIQIKNTEGSEDPTEESSTEESSSEESSSVEPSSEESSSVEPSSEESSSVEPSSEEPTQASTISTDDAQYHWLSRQSDGSFVESPVDGPQYNTEGICAIYAGNWGPQNATIVVDQTSQDPYSVDVDVTSTNNGDWLTQVAYLKTGLDAAKTYKITLKANDIVLSERVVTEVTSDQFCVNTGTHLPTGQYTLTLEAEEQTKPEPPVVQDITITPNSSQITITHQIFANWSNPSGTTYAYAYINEVDPGKGPIAANGWDFNAQAAHGPMVGLDTVIRTKDNTIQIEEGETYTLIVESFNAWDQQTGYGEVEITIPGLTPEEKEIQQYMNKINTAENLAYQKTPIVATGNKEANAYRFCDGNKETMWQADKNVDNTWFAVDLQGFYTIETVLVSWEASNATAYEIYTAGIDGVYGDTPVATVSGLPNNQKVAKLSKEIGVNARYVKVVVTGWSGNAQTYGIAPYELAVFGGEVDGYYDVSDYKSTTPYTYPTKTGKVFAGWYTDETCIEPYTENTGIAYAKFIDEKVLTVKFQKKDDNTAIRFLSSIDSCLDYQEIGFKFSGEYNNNPITEKTRTTSTVFEKIKAGGSTVLPGDPTAFDNDDSAYFFTYTIRNIDPDLFSTVEFTVTPFYVTPDGTTVEGTAGHYPQS